MDGLSATDMADACPTLAVKTRNSANSNIFFDGNITHLCELLLLQCNGLFSAKMRYASANFVMHPAFRTDLAATR
jgi:hypothetical protein